MLGKKKRPTGLKYNTQAKRNQAATMSLLSALEETAIGGDGDNNTKLLSAIEASKKILEGPPEKKYRGKEKMAAASTASSQATPSSSGEPSNFVANFNTNIGGGQTVGDLLKALQEAHEKNNRLLEENQRKYEDGFKKAVEIATAKGSPKK